MHLQALSHAKLPIAIAIAGLISACGGGGSGSNNTKPSSAPVISSSAQPASSSPASSLATSSTASSIPLANNCAATSSSSVANLPLSITVEVTPCIVVDQFGYLPNAKKIAVIRDPQVGYDAEKSFTPGATYELVDLATGLVEHSGTATLWSAGATYGPAGDKAWWFDFSSVSKPGTYAVVDKTNNVRSPGFKIGADIYQPVLKHAMRSFYYQRAGVDKVARYAEAGWTDAASHVGPGQDTEARLFSDKNNAATERDLSGGWYDAGDYNKYTSWHANYLVAMLHAYSENPDAWTDDYNIPESGNGLPDLIDEIKWGFDWLKKMQNDDGSVLSIVGLSHTNANGQHASPPSTAAGPSYYGPASTSATLTSAGALALGSKILGGLGNAELESYAEDLKLRAEKAWDWAVANPDITFRNNEGASEGLGAGQQEVDDAGRETKKLIASIYLFAATGSNDYSNHLESKASSVPSWLGPWNEPDWTAWLYYTTIPGASTSLVSKIKDTYQSSINGDDNWKAVRAGNDPYRVNLKADEYTWGSNRTVSRKGQTFHNLIDYQVGNVDAAEVRNTALDYLHYIHGTNPQAMVYLSNMYSLGVHSSVNEFYHSWFTNGSPLWDRVGTSTYGPAPGFLVGGPNPSYNWDSFCNTNPADARCEGKAPSPPKGQPPMKAYLDFNTSWPLNSWEVTENHNDYQVAYIRLLSKFVK